MIRERVTVEKATVEEEEKIKDTRARAEADRNKMVAITIAEQNAQESLVKEIKSAEAAKQSAEHLSAKALIDAEAEKAASLHRAEAIKTMAEAEAAQKAAIGMSEAQVMKAKADALEEQGEAEAAVIQMKAEAEAKGIRATAMAQAEADEKIGFADAKVRREKGMAEAEVTEIQAAADEKKGKAEANVLKEKFTADAEGIKMKAEAMKLFDNSGVLHEEYKLQLEKDKTIELANMDVQKYVAEAQARVLAEAFKEANIDIIGGESMFFNQIAGAVANGKSVDKLVNSSQILSDIRKNFLNGEGGADFKEKIGELLNSFNVSSEDVKNLTISAILFKLMGKAENSELKSNLQQMMNIAKTAGIDGETARSLGLVV